MLSSRSFLFLLPVAIAASAQAPVVSSPDPARHPVLLLWPAGAPGLEGKSGEEHIRVQGNDQVISGVHQPSLTVYLPPAAAATGAAVIVAPGGAYRELWITHEGYRVAEWLSERGIAAFVLKYRLPRETGSTYTIEGTALADIQRAIRVVRARADEWRIDPQRVGVMGFSAGAHLAGLAAASPSDPLNAPGDEVDSQSARPAFQALIYPPKLDVPLSKDTPQAFLACGGDDRISESVPDLYQALKKAGVAAELHIYAGVGHGFGIRATNSPRVAGWIDRFREWLSDRGFLASR
jgi:acetyl esterase/lipase